MVWAKLGLVKSQVSTALAAIALLSWLPVSAARAQAPDFPRARSQEIGEGGLGLRQALALTLEHAPAPRLAGLASELAAARATEAGGLFDSTGLFSLSYERSDGELRSATRKGQIQRRELERAIIRAFTQVIQDLEEQLSTDGPGLVTCPAGLEQIIVEGFGNICVSARDRLSTESLIELLKRRAEGNPEFEEIVRRYLDDAHKIVKDTLIPIFEENIDAAKVRLELLGPLPEVERRSEIVLDLRLGKLFRSGIDLSYGVVLSGVKDNFEGKPIEAFLGGKNLPNTFQSFAGFSVDMPLGKGRGRATVGAPERAAQLTHRAAVLRRVHSLSAAALRSALAYWGVVAEQERLEILDDVVATEEELLGVGRALVEADEIPRATLVLIEARLASARRSAAQARRFLHEAKLVLADSIGLAVEEPEEAPGALDGFPAAMGVPELEALDEVVLLERARRSRNDLLAVEKAREASEILLQAAQRDLRRKLDLSLTVGYSGVYESFEDEFYDLNGFAEAFSDTNVGPSAFLSFNTALPFGNRVARGELEQALAVDRRSQIVAMDLERSIRISAIEALGSLREAAAEIEGREASAGFYVRTLADTLELFRAGELSLVDTILTEEQATLARLGVVDANLAYASNLVRAMFEIGTLVNYRLESDDLLVIESVFPSDRLSEGP